MAHHISLWVQTFEQPLEGLKRVARCFNSFVRAYIATGTTNLKESPAIRLETERGHPSPADR